MFIKTLRKRIALVAVSALGFGLLSVSPVSAGVTAPTNLACTVGNGEINLSWTAATLTAGDTSITKYQYATDGATQTFKDMPVGGGATTTTRTITEISTAATALTNGTAYDISIRAVGNANDGAASSRIICTPGVPEPSQMYIATAASTTGSAAQASGLSVGATSLGWVTQTTTTATSKYTGLALSGGSAANGIVLSGAKIAFNSTSTVTSGDSLGVVVTGGTISGFACLNAGTASVNGATTTATCVQPSTTRSTAYGVLNVSAAAGSTATLSIYKGTGIAGLTTATNGVLIGTWSFTIASASLSGAYNAANSTAFIQPAIAAGGTSSSTNAFDTTSRLDNGQVAVIRVLTRDAYLSAVTGQLNASSTAGNVQITNSNVAAADTFAATSTFDSEGSWDGDGYIVVRQPTANTAGSSTVTITLDGAVIFTKTVNWNGIAASVELVAANSASIFSNGYAPGAGDGIAADGRNADVFYVVKDAAGNALTVSDAATNLSISDQTGSLVGASIVQGDTTGTLAAGDLTAVLQTKSLGYGVATMSVPSSSLRGAGTYRLAYVNAAGSTIKSAVINATVSGAAHTFTASWDKAQYNPGDIATLTISAKDSAGNLVADGVALGANSLITTNTDGFTSVTSSCDAANIATTTFSGGKKDCKFAVKNTPGSYAFTATIPTASLQAAVAGTLPIVSATAVVSNAEVLASIVKLIAAINKQIRALQKQLRR